MKKKVAVYTICKNEAKFVERFMASAREADIVYVVDTGSTDNTVKLLQKEGAFVYQTSTMPWRFDIARNVSLHLVPKDVDICVCFDLDEIFKPGWRAAVERAWTPSTTRLRYQYAWSVNPDGTPGISFWYDKIHARNGYRWVLPVHEVLQPAIGLQELQSWSTEVFLEHHPDNTKSRGSYLPLLEMAAKERPDDDRTAHYLGREYMFYGRNQDAITALKGHLDMPSATWDAERAASMRFIARCYLRQGELGQAEQWAMRACAEAPGDREPWVELGKVLYECRDWSGLYAAISRALKITERPKTYICEPFAWNYEPYDLLALAAWNLGKTDEALANAKIALSMEPNDERLRNNVLSMGGVLE